MQTKLHNYICQCENHEVVFRHPLKGAEGVPSRLGLSTRKGLRLWKTTSTIFREEGAVSVFPLPPPRGWTKAYRL